MSHLVYLPAYSSLHLTLPPLSPSILRPFCSAHLYLIASPSASTRCSHNTQYSAPVWAMVVYRHVELMDFIQSTEGLVWAWSKGVLRNWQRKRERYEGQGGGAEGERLRRQNEMHNINLCGLILPVMPCCPYLYSLLKSYQTWSPHKVSDQVKGHCWHFKLLWALFPNSPSHPFNSPSQVRQKIHTLYWSMYVCPQ